MSANRLVTIAIPTLNRAAYLKLAASSALAQTYKNFEIVISNNASTDNTAEVIAEIARDPRVRVLTQTKTLEMADNWNACVAATTGHYFLMLSDDDILEPEAIEALVSAFEDGPVPEPEVGMAFCRGKVIDENGKVFRTGPAYPEFEPASETILQFFDGKRLIWPCCILYRRSDLGEGYAKEYPLANDVAKMVRILAKRGHTVFVNRILAQYRMHRSVTNKAVIEDWHRDLIEIAELAIARVAGQWPRR